MLVDPLTTTTKQPLFKTLNPKYDQKQNIALSKSCRICKLESEGSWKQNEE
jgi:hypothetical protein